MQRYIIKSILGMLACYALLLPTAHAESGIWDFLSTTTDAIGPVHVQQVLSANTLLLDNNQKVRLIGLKALPAPEKAKTERDNYGFVIKDDQPYLSLEEQALAFVQRLVEGKKVRLEFDTQKKDADLVQQAYVFLADEEIFVNESILLNGYAALQLRPPNMKYAQRLRTAYRSARNQKKGIHGDF